LLRIERTRSPVAPLPHVLSYRDEFHLGLGELAPISFKLELFAEEAAEAVNDHQIVRPLAPSRSLDHRQELRTIVVGRRSTGLAVHVNQ